MRSTWYTSLSTIREEKIIILTSNDRPFVSPLTSDTREKGKRYSCPDSLKIFEIRHLESLQKSLIFMYNIFKTSLKAVSSSLKSHWYAYYTCDYSAYVIDNVTRVEEKSSLTRGEWRHIRSFYLHVTGWRYLGIIRAVVVPHTLREWPRKQLSRFR